MAAQNKFTYSARDLNGEIRSGVLTSESEATVARRLQSMGLAPITIQSVGGQKKGGLLGGKRKKKVKAKHLAQLCRQFATMLNAGLPLVRTIAAVTDQTDNNSLQEVLPMVRAEVESGSSFSQALSRHPMVFPPLMTGMVAAGEASGSLGETMTRVADNYEKEAKLRSKVFSAMLYPMIVLGLAIVMVVGMLLFVVPTFVSVFSGLGGELPMPTQLLIKISDGMKVIALPALVGGFVFMAWWRKNKLNPKVRAKVDPLKLKIPVMGSFFQKIALARFSRTFSSLLISGVPMLQAIDMTAKTAGNIIISDALNEVQDAVRSGRPLGAPMAQSGVFPALVTQMISTGEETGAVPEMLNKVADFYENEVDTAADALTSVLEPIMIVGLAVVVGGMVVALYLPMFSVFDLIQ